MPDYSKGKIYSIRCRTDDTLIYVGSTTQPLCERLAQHKKASNKEINKKSLIYKTINDEWDIWYIELHELCPCNNKEELCRKEGEIIRLIGTLNTRIEGRTKQEYGKEWFQVNKERLNEKHDKEWLDNKKEYNKEYYDNNKEELTNRNKEWFQANKEKRKEYNKKRYEAKKAEKLYPINQPQLN